MPFNIIPFGKVTYVTWLSGKWTVFEDVWILLKMVIFHCHVSLLEGICDDSFPFLGWFWLMRIHYQKIPRFVADVFVCKRCSFYLCILLIAFALDTLEFLRWRHQKVLTWLLCHLRVQFCPGLWLSWNDLVWTLHIMNYYDIITQLDICCTDIMCNNVSFLYCTDVCIHTFCTVSYMYNHMAYISDTLEGKQKNCLFFFETWRKNWTPKILSNDYCKRIF